MLHIPHTPFPITHTNKTELFNNKNDKNAIQNKKIKSVQSEREESS
jgi:hypothetical protein